jgi:hypothetical protein
VIAVDFYQTGDLFAVVSKLNGVDNSEEPGSDSPTKPGTQAAPKPGAQAAP